MSWSDRILEILSDGTRSPAGDSWELSYRSHSTGVTRYAASRVHQNVESDSINVRARVTVGTRVGAANTSDMRPEGVRAVLRKAYQIARSSPEDPTFDNFSPSADDRPSGEALFSRVTDELTAADRAERVNVILKRLDGDSLGAAGLVSTRTARAAVLNSRGLSAAFRGTTGCIRVFALGDDGASGYAGSVTRDFTTLDAAAIASTAARKAVRGRGPITVDPGDYDVILEPTAGSEVLEWMSMGSFGARSLENSSSLLAGRIGEQVTGKNVTIRTTDASVGGNAPAELTPRGSFADPSTSSSRGWPRAWSTTRAPPIGRAWRGSPPPPRVTPARRACRAAPTPSPWSCSRATPASDSWCPR